MKPYDGPKFDYELSWWEWCFPANLRGVSWRGVPQQLCEVRLSHGSYLKMLFLLSDVEFSKNCRFFWLLFFVTVPALLDVMIPSSTVGHPRCPSILLANKKAKAGCVGHIQPAFLLLVWMQLGCYLNPTSAGHFSVISPWMVKVGLEMQLPIVIESYLVYSFFSLSCLSSSTQHNSVRRIDFNIDFNRCLTSW